MQILSIRYTLCTSRTHTYQNTELYFHIVYIRGARKILIYLGIIVLWYCIDSQKHSIDFELVHMQRFVSAVHFMLKSPTAKAKFCNLSAVTWVFHSSTATSTETGRSKHTLLVSTQRTQAYGAVHCSAFQYIAIVLNHNPRIVINIVSAVSCKCTALVCTT